jgi:hypothetical protein
MEPTSASHSVYGAVSIINPNYQGAEDQWREVQDAARAIDRRVERALAASEQELEPAFKALVQKQVAALLVTEVAP